MATVKYFPRTTQSVHYDNMATWDVYQTGIPDPYYDDPGVFSLNETNPSIIIRGGVQQDEPYGWKFGENSRIVMSIYTENLTGSAIISEAKLSFKLKDVYKSGTWAINPSLYLVAFTPSSIDQNQSYYGFTPQATYKDDIDKGVIISNDIIDNSFLIDNARIEFNIDLTKLDIEYGDSPSYGGHTNIAIVTNYDLVGGITWNEYEYQKYEFYTHTALVDDRPYLELTFAESRSHYFEWFTKEDFDVSDPAGGGSGSSDEHWDNVSVVIRGDEIVTGTTFTAVSGSTPAGHTVTLIGGMTTGTGKWSDGGYVLDGDNDYMTIDAHADFDLDRVFTVEAWLKSETHINDPDGFNYRGQFWSGGTVNVDNFYAYGAMEQVDGTLSADGNIPGPDLWVTPISGFNPDDWCHYAYVNDTTGLRLYINGAFKGKQAHTFDLGNATVDILLGILPANALATWQIPQRWYKGTISELRVTKGVSRYTGEGTSDWGWDQEEITEAFSISSSGGGGGLVDGEKGDALWDNVTGYYRFNDDFEDRSERSGDIEIIGINELITEGMWTGAGSLKLSNAYSYRNAIRLEGDTINFGSDDFCIEFSFKVDASFSLTNGVDYYLMDFREVIDLPSNLQYLILKNTSGTINLTDHTSTKLKDSTNADFIFTTDTWYHIAVSKDGNNVRVFIDGKCNNVNFAVGDFGGQEIWINSRVDTISGVYNLDGQASDIYIDELRITTDNKRYTHGSDFTTLTQEHYDYEIPTSVGDDFWSQTSLLLKFDETSIYDYSAGELDLFTNLPTDDSKNQKTVSQQGDPYVAFNLGTYIAGNGSLYLDSNSYLILPDHSEYDFGIDDFTIEFYVKFPTSTHIQWIFSFDGELGENDWRLGINAGGFLTFNQVGSGIVSGSSIDFNNANMLMDDDDWHKVSLCREATSGSLCDMTCHISTEIIGSGANQRSQTITTISLVGLNNITTQKYIGYNPANVSDKFVGYLDEIRITNGTARYSNTVADPYSANDDPIKLLPTIAQYWDYEEPPIGAEIEDTDLSVTHFEYILLPFVVERPQFIDGNMQLIALTHRGELLDGIDTRLNRVVTDGSDSDVMFSFNNGNMQFLRYWNESEDNTTLSVVNDLVTQEAIDDLVGATLDTSTVTSGQTITEQIFIFEELLPFADLPLMIPVLKDDGVTQAIANIDGWTPEQFSFNNSFNMIPDYRWDKTDIGIYTISVANHQDELSDGDYPISFNFVDGVYVGDSTSVKSLEDVHSNFVIGVNEWYSETFDKDIVSSSFADSIYDFDNQIYIQAIDSSGMKTFDDWERRTFQFINDVSGAYGVIDDFGLNLTEDNYSYATGYSADNHYGYHLNEVDKIVSFGNIDVVDSIDGSKMLYDIEILEEIATIDKDDNIINRFKETIVNWFDYVGFAPHVDVLKEIDPNHYIMFTELLLTDGIEHNLSIFKDDGTTLARTGSDDLSVYSFSETFDDITITDGYDTYTSYETQKDYLNNDVPKWNYTDLVEGTVLDPRIERDLITGMQHISEEELLLSSEFAITSQYLLTSVMGNFWHQSYRFNNGFDTVLDIRYSNDYTETFDLSAKSFHVVGGNQQDGDIFTIYRDQSNTGSTALTVLTVEPDPSLKLTDEHSSNIELLITGTNTISNLEGSSVTVSGTAVDFSYDAGGEISGWQLEENYVATLADNTILNCSSIDTSGSAVTVDWWGYRDASDATTPFDEWWNGGTSSFRNTINQTGTQGSTGKWSFYSTSGTPTTWINFQDIDDTGWHHWSFVREGTNLYFFLDGILIAGETASFDQVIDFTNIGQGLQGKIKNFRVTNNVARWTSNFDDILYTMKGEWEKDGSDYKIQVSPKLGVFLGSITSHTDPTGINDFKIATGTGGRFISGFLQNNIDMSSYWGESFASTPTVRGVAGKNVDIRWAWSNSPIPVWDENADGSRGEVHPLVLVSDNIETDLKEFYSDSDHFYQFIQAFGNTLEGFGFPSGGGGGVDDNWDDVVLLINGTETFASTFSDKSDTPHTITVNGSAINQTTSDGGKWLEGYDFSGGSANTDYFSIPDSDDWTFGSDPFTIEFWIYLDPQATNTGTRNIFSHGNVSQQEHFLSVYNNAGDLQMDWNVRGGLSSNVAVWDANGDTNISSEEWIHVALVRNGTLWSMYFNGKFKYSVSGPSGSIQDYSNDFRIGVQSGSTSRNPFSGYIDDFRITKGVARYSGTDTSDDWENFEEIDESFSTGSSEGGVNPLNISTINGVEVLLQEEQTDRQFINMPLNDDSISGIVDLSGDDFVSYVIQPALPGLDDLTPENFQFLGNNIVVIDSRVKKYDDAVTDNSYKMVSGGFDVLIDSGQYLDTQVDADGNYITTGNNSNIIPNTVHTVENDIRKVVYSGNPAEDLLGAGGFYETHSSSAPQNIKDPHRVDFDEKFDIDTTDIVLGQNTDRSTKTENWSKDQFGFTNGRCDIILDSSFESLHPFSGTVLDVANPPSNTMLQTIFEGRISLDISLVNQYDAEGNKKIKLQSIFDDEEYFFESPTIINDNYSQSLTWDSLDWLSENILEIANFGGDFFQFLNAGFNPLADTIKLADFGDASSSNTFLNLVSQTLDDVDYLYDVGTGILTLSLDPAKVNVSTAYTEFDYIWVGRLEENEGEIKLDINLHKFWQIVERDTVFNTIGLSVPSSDAGNFITPPVGDEEGLATLLLSSTNMTQLMYYYRRL